MNFGMGLNASTQQTGPAKVVYHIDNADTQGSKAIHTCNYHEASQPPHLNL